MDIQYRSITSFLPILVAKTVVKVQAAIDYEGCSDQNQCFGFPKGCIDDTTCTIVTSLKVSRENIDVKLMHRTSFTSIYAAMAFSDDQKMGSDLVFACSPSWMNTKEKDVNVFWNPINARSELLNEKIFKNASTFYADGTLTCKFTLEKDVTVKETLFDFRNGYHILLARGVAGDAKLNHHTDRIASKHKFAKLENQTETVGTSMSVSSKFVGTSMSTLSPEVETNKSTNTSDNSTKSENKQTTMASFSSTEGKSTSTISQNPENNTSKITTLENKSITKAATDEDDKEKATGLATTHFVSIIAIYIMFFPFFFNA